MDRLRDALLASQPETLPAPNFHGELLPAPAGTDADLGDLTRLLTYH